MKNFEDDRRGKGRRYSGSEPIGATGKTVHDYWRWSTDLLENKQRGIFAEYLVAEALGEVTRPGNGWHGFDFLYKGAKIEVKSSAYLQSWRQSTLSPPRFGVGAKKQWNEVTGGHGERIRAADIFVFCLFGEKDENVADILKLEKWEFFVLPTWRIQAELKGAKFVGLDRLRKMASAVRFEDVREKVDALMLRPVMM